MTAPRRRALSRVGAHLAALLALVASCGQARDNDGRGGDDARPGARAGEAVGAARDGGAIDARRARPRITIVAVGDILFGRYLTDRSYARVVREVADPFGDVAPILRGADLAFANLENPVRTAPDDFYINWLLTFRSEPGDAAMLVDAGFDVLSIANNHMRDIGPSSPTMTRAHLDRAGLVAVGAGKDAAAAYQPALVVRNGVRVAFIARTVWLKGISEPVNVDGAVAMTQNRDLPGDLVAEVERVRAELEPDFVVVSLHWGWEYEIHPDSSQRKAARMAIDAGADLVIGHHPHVVQDVEYYRGGVIAYSLGNFLFDAGGRGQRKSAILEVTLDGRGDERQVIAAMLHPILLDQATHTPRRARRGGYRAWGAELAELAPDIALAPRPVD